MRSINKGIDGTTGNQRPQQVRKVLHCLQKYIHLLLKNIIARQMILGNNLQYKCSSTLEVSDIRNVKRTIGHHGSR